MGDFNEYTTDGLRHHVQLMQKEIARRQAEPAKTYGEREAERLIRRYSIRPEGDGSEYVSFDGGAKGGLRLARTCEHDLLDLLLHDLRAIFADRLDAARCDAFEAAARECDRWSNAGANNAAAAIRGMK